MGYALKKFRKLEKKQKKGGGGGGGGVPTFFLYS